MATPAPIPGVGPQRPSLSLRLKAAMIMGATGILSKAFLYGLNRVEVNGLSRFLDILDSRKDPAKRERGLLTVSNHVSVLDDPVVWGILPFRYIIDPSNLRWTLGAADICFANKLFSNFFTHGQVLPCHRLKHSPYGGPFQPAITQALGLLSKPSFASSTNLPFSRPPPNSDGTSDGQLQHHPAYYTTTGRDLHPSPLSYPLHRRYSWVHVFPEGCVHQHSGCDLRYFKWGLARLILESDPVPDVLPMFIDGTQHAMPEDRGFPRFLPRIGKTVRVTFGEVLDYEATFGDLKRRWDRLVVRERERERLASRGGNPTYHDTTLPPTLRNGPEAQEIRIQVALRMRDEILKLRRSLGRYPDPEPSFGLAETWREDGGIEAKRYKSRVDGSDIGQD
ncbi:uncharacterized protein C8A04DRAFT_9883 [Dichotomopilus funicola]|uniref:Tafazzin family protein n=1 Tax=Dichotomopilus funicola TaxID=1934379 RepID=A0AAN6V7F6_9PEZI|nr:hypothetical protein C8A04DRAFT_9883 [Dichotomopilus funicola]